MTSEEYLTTLQERLTRYIAAETKILSGQAYSIGNRSLTRADLKEVRAEIIYLYSEIAKLQGGSIKLQRVVPIQ